MIEEFHFIGIGGIGMSGLAKILLEKQKKVSGSDLTLSERLKELQVRGARLNIGHDEKVISETLTIVYSTDIKKDNPELLKAIEKKCRVIHRSELLAELMQGFKGLAVAGTHGKTTTSSLLAHVLHTAGLDPSFAVGGEIVGAGNGKHGGGDYFVAEADESDGTFLNYAPFGAIVTNCEEEHMNHYETKENLVKAFQSFLEKVSSKKHLFVCGDDPILAAFPHHKETTLYGFEERCGLRISNFRQMRWNIVFDVAVNNKVYKEISLPLLGRHNALNGAAVFGLALSLGLNEEVIRKAFLEFKGVGRRLEKKGEYRGSLFFDDYGHHPTEVHKTIMALKESIGPRRLIVVFQPHRYTRTANFLEEFSRSFHFADHLFVSEIYGANEPPIAGITSQALVEKIEKNSTVPVQFLPRDKIVSKLKEMVRPLDVVLTLGAGDITKIHGDLKATFEKEAPKKYVVGLVFGGNSCEHEISLRSTRFVAESLDQTLFDIEYLGIDKGGGWIAGQRAKELLHNESKIDAGVGEPLLSPAICQSLSRCDLFFPILHGPNGEDGTMQGFFEMLGKPYAGPDFRGCAIAMDKALTKKLLLQAGVATPNFTSFSYYMWLREEEKLCSQIEKELKFPLMVKPVHTGSSVGISKAFNFEELRKGVEEAFRYDTILLIEEAKEECRELEFPVIGDTFEEVKVASLPGEKCAEGRVVDYQMKYSQNPVKMTIAPELSEELRVRGRETAKRAYEAIGATGMARVDCLMDSEGTFWFFEINPIPGLTKLSLFPKIWDRDGLKPAELLSELVLLGLSRRRTQDRHVKPIEG